MADTSFFTRFSHTVSRAAGRPITFAVACAGIVLWAASGPLFGFSETWQLVVNTSTTIITFLMVFILQNTQNRDGEAIQAKLDELILSSTAENKFIGAETLTEDELHQLRGLVKKASENAVDNAPTVALKTPPKRTTRRAPAGKKAMAPPEKQV